MKKFIARLARIGIGLMLFLVCFENSLAKEGNLVLQSYAFSSDSLRTMSLQNIADDNMNRLKPGSVSGGKLAGEFLLGGAGSVASGLLLAKLMAGKKPEDNNKSFLSFDFDFGYYIGLISGYLIGSNLGCAGGVSIIGNNGEEDGDYAAALGGSLLGSLVGGATVLAMGWDADDPISPPLYVFTFVQSLGATWGFNLSAKRKNVESLSSALLNLRDEKLTLAFPKVNITLKSNNSTLYRINLFQAKF